jgi:hypothetical protein
MEVFMPNIDGQKSPFTPQFCADISFDSDESGYEIYVVCDSTYYLDNGEGEIFKLTRSSKRWRSGGMLISKHAIAKSIFKYSEKPTEDEIDFMTSFIDALGSACDQCNETARIASKRIINEQKRRDEELASAYRTSLVQEFKSSNESWCSSKIDYIYLMSHTNGLTKIGKSVDPKAREKTLQAEDPRLEMIFHHPSWDGLERKLHRIFADLRVRGEWFKLEDRHIDWIMFFLKSINPQQEAVGL